MSRGVAAIVALTTLVACQHAAPPKAILGQQPLTAEQKKKLFPRDVCDPAVTNPYLIEECDHKLAREGKPPDPRSETARQQRLADHQRVVAEQQAHAQCSYQAQMANLSTPGLITGFFNGIGAGQACEQYYRAIGVMP